MRRRPERPPAPRTRTTWRASTSTVTRLAAGTAYSFAVFARDGLGRLGTSSPAVNVEGSTMTLAEDRATVRRGTDVLLSGGMRDTSGAGIGGRSVVLYYRPARH